MYFWKYYCLRKDERLVKNFWMPILEAFILPIFLCTQLGVILFRNTKEDIFQKFAKDVIFNIEVIGLRKELYNELTSIKRTLGFNFDDAYQYRVAKEYGLEIVTPDMDVDLELDSIKNPQKYPLIAI